MSVQDNSDEIKTQQRKRFEVMAVRMAQYLNLSQAEKFEGLPPAIRQHLEGLRYCDVIRPLVLSDHAAGQSMRAIAIKYAISKTAVLNCVKKNRPNKVDGFSKD